MNNRVVITGVGIASVCGFGKEDFWKGILSGSARFSQVNDSFYGPDFKGQYGMLDKERQQKLEERYLSDKEKGLGPCARLALATSLEAMDDARVLDAFDDVEPERRGVSIGTTHGEITFLEDAVQHSGITKVDEVRTGFAHQEIAASIARRMGARGDVVVHSDACSSGNIAAAYGFQMIRQGRLDRVVVGGVDVYSKLTEGVFSCIRALTDDKVRPFDENRSGIILSEGAGMLILESYETAKRRGAHIYGEVYGQGQTNDAYHMAVLDPEATGIVGAMGKAVQDAGISKDEIDYVCLHGTGTVANDKCEMKGLKDFFGDRVSELKVSSIKGTLGHGLGSAAALELVACALSLDTGIIPPNTNVENLDSECTFNLITEPVAANPAMMINNSYAFGGSNCCVIVGREQGES